MDIENEKNPLKGEREGREEEVDARKIVADDRSLGSSTARDASRPLYRTRTRTSRQTGVRVKPCIKFCIHC